MITQKDSAMTDKPYFQFHHNAFSPDDITMGRKEDDLFRKFHYDLCQGINMTRVSIALGQMVEAGTLDKRMAELFHMQAGALLALMTSENNRAFAGGCFSTSAAASPTS